MKVHDPYMLVAAIVIAAFAAWSGLERWRSMQDVAYAPAEVYEVVARRDICGEYRALRDSRRDCTRFIAHARFSVDGRFHVVAYDAGAVDGRMVPSSASRVKVGQRVPAAYRRSNPDDAWLGTVGETWALPLWSAALAAACLAFAMFPNEPVGPLRRLMGRLEEMGRAKRETELRRRAEAERQRAAADQRRFEQD